MSVSVVNAGASVSSTNGITPGLPASLVQGNALLLLVSTGQLEEQTPTTDASWTVLGTASGGSGAFGAGTGPRRSTAFVKVLTAGNVADAAPAVSMGGTITNSTTTGQIWQLTKTVAGAWIFEATGGADTSSGTAFSVTGAATLATTTGDLLWGLASYAPATSVVPSAPAFSATGATVGAVTTRADIDSSWGGDVRSVMHSASVTGGPATGAPTHTLTLSAAAAGSALIVRAAETVVSGSVLTFASVTATGWTPTGGTAAAVLSDSDDATYLTSPGNPSASTVDLVLRPIEPPAGDFVVTLRGSRIDAASSTVAVTLRDGTTTAATATVTGALSGTTSALTATFPAANLTGVTAAKWRAGTLVVRAAVTAA